MYYKKLYILLLVLPMVLMAAKSTKVLQRGLDGYDGAQDACIKSWYYTNDTKPGAVTWDTGSVCLNSLGIVSAGEDHW